MKTDFLDCGTLEGAETTVCHAPIQCGFDTEVVHKAIEFIIDPGSGELSASRACFIYMNVLGGLLAVAMVILGLLWNIPHVFTPVSVIITGLVASDAGVYFASTKKNYRCNKESNGD